MPFVGAIVTEVSLADSTIEIDPPDGLLDLGLDRAVRIDVVTIFPDYLDPLRQSLPGKAIETGIIDWRCTTCAGGPMTCTARSTTRHTAAAPAW